jgi:hypothetical protein
MTDFFENLADNSVKSVDNSIKPAHLTAQLCFGQIFLFFTEFLKIRRIRHLPNFKEPPDFETLVCSQYCENNSNV